VARPAIFLDRDGVLNRNDADHVKCWSEFSFLPHTLAALRRLARLPASIITITNQAVVNRGLASTSAIEEIHWRMTHQVLAAGGRIDHVYYCPHRPDERCACRKPEPGLLLAAAAEHDIDLSRSVFVGDALTDVIAGKRAGCGTVLVMTGRGRSARLQLNGNALALPDVIAEDLYQAVPLIMDILHNRSHGMVPIDIAASAVGFASAGHQPQ